MNITRLRRIKKIDLAKEDSVEVVKYKYANSLKLFGFRTGIESFGVSFKRKIKTITHSGENRIDAMKIFREGNIYIFIESKQINVNWLVKLDTLYFLSFMIGLVIGFVTNFLFNYSLFISFVTGLTGLIVFVIVGILIIRSRIDEINFVCIDEQSKSNAP